MEVERRLDSLAAGWSPPEARGGAGGLLSTQTLAEASVTKALRCTSSSSRIANDSNPPTEKTPREWAPVLSIRSSTSLLRRKSVTRCRAILCGGREAGDTAHRQL